jgi:hypothetical protein
MRRLLTGYVVAFNLRYERQGHLFQNRYKSILCDEEPYLFQLIRYIHLNPIRAGLVSEVQELNRYPYCGHSALMGSIECDWQDVDAVLRVFGEDRIKAREQYLRFVENGLAMDRDQDPIRGDLGPSTKGGNQAAGQFTLDAQVRRDERVLGSNGFFDRSRTDLAREPLIKQDTAWKKWDLAGLANRVAELGGVSVESMMSKGKQRSVVQAKSLFCFLAAEKLGVRMTDLANFLSMTNAGVGYAVSRGRRIFEESLSNSYIESIFQNTEPY